MSYNLNLGCGNAPIKGHVNHDRDYHSDYVDVAWDLEGAWPEVLEENGRFIAEHRPFISAGTLIRFDAITIKDVLEHIAPNRFFHVLNSMWAKLVPGGIANIEVPQWGSENALIDQTHWRGFHINSFDILDPATPLGRKNKFYDNRPWEVVSKIVKPKSTVNLQFTLRKRDA
jgi:hypothetical protein